MNNWFAATALERFWAAVALEIAVIFLVAHALQGLVRSGWGPRTLRQVAFLYAILVIWLEACGAGELAAQWGRSRLPSPSRRPPTDTTLVVTSSPRKAVVTGQAQGSVPLVSGVGPVQNRPT